MPHYSVMRSQREIQKVCIHEPVDHPVTIEIPGIPKHPIHPGTLRHFKKNNEVKHKKTDGWEYSFPCQKCGVQLFECEVEVEA